MGMQEPLNAIQMKSLAVESLGIETGCTEYALGLDRASHHTGLLPRGQQVQMKSVSSTFSLYQ